MKHMYQCKVCLETFSLLRYLRKHVTIPASVDHQPNKCQSYYSRTANLQENLMVNHKIVPETPSEELNCKTKQQRVHLISTSNNENIGYSKDDDCGNIEDELSCLKFEPDEEDELYFFDRENPIILPDNDVANISSTRFVNNADKTKQDKAETGFFEDEKQVKSSIKPVIFKHHKSQTPEISTDVLPANTTEINSAAETTICKTCKMACTSLENLCIHYETLHKLPVVVLARVIANQKNPKCKRTEASNSKEAIKETRTHQCGICSKRFATLKSFKRHKSSVHDGKIFNCNVCQKTFHYVESLKNHKLSAHDGCHYRCNICARTFTYLSQLNRHKSSIHDNVRFRCDICQKEFNRLDNLKAHKLNRHEHAMYKCNNCPKQFHSAQSLSSHKAGVHKGIRYTCELCKKQFMQQQWLRQHKASIHDGVRYTCKLCKKQFSNTRTLRNHKASVHGGVRYKCDYCLKVYSHMSNLIRHKSVKHKPQRFRENFA